MPVVLNTTTLNLSSENIPPVICHELHTELSLGIVDPVFSLPQFLPHSAAIETTRANK